MSVVRVEELSNDDKLVLEFNNGDKMKLEEIMTDWNFKDEESFLRFAMVMFSESADKKTIAYLDKYGNVMQSQPKITLLKSK